MSTIIGLPPPCTAFGNRLSDGCCIDDACPYRGWFGHGMDKAMDAWLGGEKTRAYRDRVIRRYRIPTLESEG